MTTIAHGLGPTRARVLALLQTSATPLTISEIAERLGLHQNSSRFHLEALVSTGYANRVQAETGAPGRPPMRYHATTESPELHHTHLLELTQTLLGQLSQLTPDPAASATEAGRSWGRQITPKTTSAPGEPELIITDLIGHLGERGFTTTRDEQGLCFPRCPFRGAIRPDLLPLVCAVHQGFLEGYLEDTGVGCDQLRIGPQLCQVRLNW
ncbi:MAG: helix-turn-helix domain-containing protein [Propionibacteriaceae bacterium]|nr:helix-turn-helix domain-containing protein [Propionibacteriaceae bacterium]